MLGLSRIAAAILSQLFQQYRYVMRFYAANKISENIVETDEGYLICLGVPIARTGTQEYLPEEVGEDAEAGEGGYISVDRPESEVFKERAIASFSGKPVTIDHPGEGVNPINWKSLAVGTTTNVRRGDGEMIDFMVADLFITDERAINLIKNGLREISCGYDVEYEIDGPGRATQRNIIGNHVALVPEGRCGSRCAIGDKKNSKETTMAKKKKATTMDKLARILRLVKAVDAMEEEEVLKDEEIEKEEPEKKGEDMDPEEMDHDPEEMASLEERLDRIEAAVALLIAAEEGQHSEEMEDEDPDSEELEERAEELEEDEEEEDECGSKIVGDKKVYAQDIRARAEIIAPGVGSLMIKDSCALKRRALSRAYIGDNKAVIDRMNGGKPVKSFKAMDKVTLDAAFMALSEIAKAKNNRRVKDDSPPKIATGPMTPAEINKANAEMFGKKS